MNKPIIGFAGMTHLGINSAVATAERGFDVICYDSDENLITRLQNQILPIVEPDLPELFAKNMAESKLKFSAKIQALFQCDVVYISVDVPTNHQGESDLAGIKTLISTVATQLNPTALLIILCQVPPGFTRHLEINLPQSRICYQVETLIFGKAVERALNPERFIVGCEQPDLPIDSRYRMLLEAFACPILPMRYESAELAKISINCCLVASIGVANTLSEICEKIGANWAEIVPALKLDKRIGPHAYLAPGLGISGGNLERDLTTVRQLSETHGTDAGIVNAWILNSQHRKNWVLKTLHQHVFPNNPNPTIGILGLAYKENTHSTKNSPSLALLQHLKSFHVQVFDPEVNAEIVPWAQGKTSCLQAAENADVLIVMTPWTMFRSLTPTGLKKQMRGNIIIDPFRLLDAPEFEAHGFRFLTLGINVSC
jgi:UDPglucose 6-dehydrogenase